MAIYRLNHQITSSDENPQVDYQHFRHRFHEPDLAELQEVVPRYINLIPVEAGEETLEGSPHKLYVEKMVPGGWEQLASFALIKAGDSEPIDQTHPQFHGQ